MVKRLLSLLVTFTFLIESTGISYALRPASVSSANRSPAEIGYSISKKTSSAGNTSLGMDFYGIVGSESERHIIALSIISILQNIDTPPGDDFFVKTFAFLKEKNPRLITTVIYDFILGFHGFIANEFNEDTALFLSKGEGYGIALRRVGEEMGNLIRNRTRAVPYADLNDKLIDHKLAEREKVVFEYSGFLLKLVLTGHFGDSVLEHILILEEERAFDAKKYYFKPKEFDYYEYPAEYIISNAVASNQAEWIPALLSISQNNRVLGASPLINFLIRVGADETVSAEQYSSLKLEELILEMDNHEINEYEYYLLLRKIYHHFVDESLSTDPERVGRYWKNNERIDLRNDSMESKFKVKFIENLERVISNSASKFVQEMAFTLYAKLLDVSVDKKLKCYKRMLNSNLEAIDDLPTRAWIAVSLRYYLHAVHKAEIGQTGVVFLLNTFFDLIHETTDYHSIMQRLHNRVDEIKDKIQIKELAVTHVGEIAKIVLGDNSVVTETKPTSPHAGYNSFVRIRSSA